MSISLPGARAWRQRGILALLTVVFVGSGLLRLGEFGTAFAATGDDEMPIQGDDGDMAELGSCPNMGAVSMALASIDGRAEALDLREMEIAERQSQLDAAEQLVTARLAELEAAEDRLNALLDATDVAAESDVEQLIAFYEAMSSEDAAELFMEMDPNFAAGFLSRMRPESGAGILAELEPDQAYAISVILATRNADVPRSSMTDSLQ
jgi:flagellar motility protein MotE (MotC chaperone)